MTPSVVPVGTATFLFTDIEGSTRLEEALGTAAYAAIRERHRELLRVAFAAHDGKEQGTEGDSFFVVFASAREALAAAIEGTRALAVEPPIEAAVPLLGRAGRHGVGDVVLVGPRHPAPRADLDLAWLEPEDADAHL